MISTFAEGFMLGLSTGISCLATCGPVYAPYLMQYERDLVKNLFVICELSAGRFFAYIIVGAAAGVIGRQLNFEGKSLITASGYILFSAFLLFTVFRTHQRDHHCHIGKFKKNGILDRPILLGLLTGVNICPPFLMALTKAFEGSGPIAGMSLFTSFFIGTTLFLLPVSAFGILGSKLTFRKIARWSAVVVSIWFCTLATIQIFRYFW
jgi:sulfite exporter TauE/SafE